MATITPEETFEIAQELVPLRAELARDPHNAKHLHRVAKLFVSKELIPGAICYMQQALGIEPENADFHRDVGDCYTKMGQYDKALFHLRRAASLEPTSAENLRSLGSVLCAVKDLDTAIAILQQASGLKNKRALTFSLLSMASYQKSDFPSAKRYAEESLKLDPGLHDSRLHLATACAQLGEFEVAIRHATQAARRRPIQGLPMMAMVLNRMNEPERAAEVCRHLLRLRPGDAQVHFLLAWALLLTGEYESGWKEYEWRLRKTAGNGFLPHFGARIKEQMWRGESIRDKTLLVQGEQGFGDNIQFVRYVHKVAQQGGRIVLSTRKELVRLFRDLPGVMHCCEYAEPVPKYDYQIMIGSLPQLFTRSVNDIPGSVPYLILEKLPPSRFRPKHQNRLNVGVVWAGSTLGPDDMRAIDIDSFSKLFRISEVDFYCLQVGTKAPYAVPYLSKNVFLVPNPPRDFADTAGVLTRLDLLVTIDSGIAHLAGALGVKTFMLLPFAADFRWFKNDPNSEFYRRSPWYPTMRLFRQTNFGDWNDVIRNVVQAVRCESRDKNHFSN